MKLCNDVLTLYNQRYNKAKDATEYVRTVISGISWYSTVKSAVSDKGLKSANMYVIRIPATAGFSGKSWTDPKSYTAADDVSSLFTLNEGDIVVKGALADENPTFAQLHKNNAECFTVLSVTDNRRAPNAPHWKVVGA